jgi:hypothetical protein
VEDNSFHNDPEDLGRIITSIDAEIHGLFPIESLAKRSVAPKAAVKPAAKTAAKAATKGTAKKALAKAR